MSRNTWVYEPKFDGFPVRSDDYETKWTCGSCGAMHIYRLKNVCDCVGVGFENASPRRASEEG